MPRILKRFITTNPKGRVLDSKTERLVDDGRGRTNVTVRQLKKRCPNCFAYVEESQIRGQCDFCHHRLCCERCATKCQICSRMLCSDCRRGFAGDRLFTVCPICLRRLQSRQSFVDQQTIHNLTLQRHARHQQELARFRAQQLQAARLRMSGKLQMARLNMQARIAANRENRRRKMALARLISYAQRYL